MRFCWLWVSKDFVYSKNGSFRSHQVYQSQWPTTNLSSLFIVFIYSMPWPSLSLFFHHGFARKLQKARYLSFQYSSNSYFPRWRCFDQVIWSSSVFLWSSCLNILLNSTSRSRLAKCNAIYSQISKNTSLVNRRARMCLNHVRDKLHSIWLNLCSS